MELLDDVSELVELLLSPDPLLALLESLELGLEEAYRSEYQPPPFRMNPAPPDTRRLAVSSPQFGQVFSASSLMD